MKKQPSNEGQSGIHALLAAEERRRYQFRQTLEKAQFDILDATMMKRKGEILTIYRNHIQQSPRVTPKALISALQSISSLSFREVLFAHRLVSFLVKRKAVFEPPYNDLNHLRAFLMRCLYGHLVDLTLAEGQRMLLKEMLQKAQSLALLSEDGVESLILVLRLKKHVDGRFEKLTDVLDDIYKDFSGCLTVVETLLCSIEISLKRMKMAQDRGKRIAMWSSLVKLGLSVIPIAGQIASAAVDIAAKGTEIISEAVLSESSIEILDAISELFSSTGETAIDLLALEKGDITHEQGENIAAAKLGRLSMSSEFRSRMPTAYREKLIDTIESAWGTSVEEAEKEVHVILNTFCDVKDPVQFEITEMSLFGRDTFLETEELFNEGGSTSITFDSPGVYEYFGATIGTHPATVRSQVESVQPPSKLATESELDAIIRKISDAPSIPSRAHFPDMMPVDTAADMCLGPLQQHGSSHTTDIVSSTYTGIDDSAGDEILQVHSARKVFHRALGVNEHEKSGQLSHEEAVAALKGVFSVVEVGWLLKFSVEIALLNTDKDGTYRVGEEQFCIALKEIQEAVNEIREKCLSTPWGQRFMGATPSNTGLANIPLACRLIRDFKGDDAPDERELLSVVEDHATDGMVGLAQYSAILDLLKSADDRLK